MRMLLLVAALLVAGCSSAPASDPAAANGPSSSGPGLAGDNLTAPAPVWRVGETWEHKWEIHGQGIAPFSVKAVVARDDGATWLVGATDASTAAFHAAFFFPDLGSFSKTDLTDTAGDFTSPWYSFPLSDGKTWSGREKQIDLTGTLVENQIDYVAHLAPKEDGSPRFHVIAKIGGNLRAMYDYDPAYQWFSSFAYYNATAAAVADSPLITIESSVPAFGFKGTVYASTGDLLLQLVSQFGVLGDPDPTHIQPTGTFTPATTHDHLLIIEFNFAVCGAQATVLLPPPPTGGSYAPYPLVDADVPTCANMGSGAGSGNNLYIPSIAGDWHIVTVGANVIIGGGGIFAYGITEVLIEVVPAAAPAPTMSAPPS